MVIAHAALDVKMKISGLSLYLQKHTSTQKNNALEVLLDIWNFFTQIAHKKDLYCFCNNLLGIVEECSWELPHKK